MVSAWPCSNGAGSALLLWPWAGAVLCDPGQRRDGAMVGKEEGEEMGEAEESWESRGEMGKQMRDGGGDPRVQG